MDDGLDDILRELSQRFSDKLQEHFTELQANAVLVKASDDPRAQPALAELIRTLHKLAGSAGTFGHAALGDEARRLEQLLCQDSSFESASRPLLEQALADVVGLVRHSDSAGTTSAQPVRSHTTDGRILLLEQRPGSLSGPLSLLGYETTAHASLSTLLADRGSVDDMLVIDLGDASRDEVISTLDRITAHAMPARILLVTTHTDFELRLHAVRSGAVGLLAAPLRISALEALLEQRLVQRQEAPYRILVIDDDIELASYYQLVMGHAGLNVAIVHEASAALPVIHEFRPDVLLLDVGMPGCSGPELAQIIRLDESLLQIPIIYLSAETDADRQMQAMLHAGDDFLTKPISDRALVAAAYARAQRARRLGQAIACDSLTGLLRHNDIKARIELELTRRRRQPQPLTVVMLDIDHFKQVNDRHGHQAGDQVIRTLANLLRQRLRKTDGIGRYGGEEYAIALPGCTGEQAVTLLDTIRDSFSRLCFEGTQAAFSITFSAGVAEATDTDDLTGLIERADRALYAAKRQGRNRIITD